MRQHPSMRHTELPTKQGLAGGGQGTTEHGPGRPNKTGRSPSTQTQPGPQPASRRANLLALISPGGSSAIDHRELPEPVALQPIH